MLFKKTINISELKVNALEILGDLGDDGPREAIQLVHRGQSIKVIITQERYFRLIEAFESLRELEAQPTAEEVVNRLETLSGKLGLKQKSAIHRKRATKADTINANRGKRTAGTRVSTINVKPRDSCFLYFGKRNEER